MRILYLIFGFADFAKVGVVKSFGVLKAVAERAVDKNMKEPQERDKQHAFV